MSGQRCETCRFWVAGPGLEGECHRNPPEVNHALALLMAENAMRLGRGIEDAREETQTSRFGVWPSTLNADWCGEWRKQTE